MWNTALVMLAVAVTLVAAALTLPEDSPWMHWVFWGAIASACLFAVLGAFSGISAFIKWGRERSRSLVILEDNWHCTYWTTSQRIEVRVPLHKESPTSYFVPCKCDVQFAQGLTIQGDVIRPSQCKVDGVMMARDRYNATFLRSMCSYQPCQTLP
jgi:hypothetical protein